MSKRGVVIVMVLMALSFLLVNGPASGAQKGKLHIYFMNPFPPHVQRAEATIAEYKKINPEVEFTLETLGFTNFLQKIVAAKSAGAPPDLVYSIPDHMWTLYGNGWLMDVDDVIDRLGGDRYFQPLPGFAKVGGHHWGVPMSSYTMHIQYRKDLFEKKGLKEPRTWDDLLKAAKALTEDLNGDGRIDRYGIALPLKTEYSVDVFFLGFLWGNGGNILDKNGKVVFNSPETVQTLNFFKELYKYAPPGVTGYGWMELIATYIQDKVAMTTFSNLKPIADAIKQNEMIAQNTGVIATPTRLASQTPKGRWANMTWMVLKDTKYPELAKDFVAFWFDPTRLTQYYHAEPVFTVPGETPVINSKEYWSNDLLIKYRPAVEKLIELNRNGIDPNMEHPGILNSNSGMIAQRMIICEAVQEVVLGKSSAEAAAAKAHKKMEEFLAKKQ